MLNLANESNENCPPNLHYRGSFSQDGGTAHKNLTQNDHNNRYFTFAYYLGGVTK